MRMSRGGLAGLTAKDLDRLKRRQAHLLRGDMDIRPAPRSRRARNSRGVTTAQAEQLIRAIRSAFDF